MESGFCSANRFWEPLMTKSAEPVDWSSLQEQFRRADHTAFDCLVDAFWDPVMRYFFKRCDRAEAEDLAQNVFTSVYQTVRQGRSETPTDADSWRRYLLAAARHRLIDHRRCTGSRPKLTSLERLFDEEHAGEGLRAPSRARSRDEGEGVAELMDEEKRVAVRSCLGELKVEERAVCWNHYVDGVSKREIARRLERPESSIRLLLQRALAALRYCLVSKGLSLEDQLSEP